jgi:hypothetical protein
MTEINSICTTCEKFVSVKELILETTNMRIVLSCGHERRIYNVGT